MTDIDTVLYDAVMAELGINGSGFYGDNRAIYERAFHDAALVSARISADHVPDDTSDPPSWHRGYRKGYERGQLEAQRHQVPVSDEDLAGIFLAAFNASEADDWTDTDGPSPHIVAGIRAVRVALIPRVPVILPTLFGQYRVIDHYTIGPNTDGSWTVACWNGNEFDDLIADFTGPTWQHALTDAITAAQEAVK